MPRYLILMQLTNQGAKGIKEAPGRIDAGIKAWEGMGGKLELIVPNEEVAP